MDYLRLVDDCDDAGDDGDAGDVAGSMDSSDRAGMDMVVESYAENVAAMAVDMGSSVVENQMANDVRVDAVMETDDVKKYHLEMLALSIRRTNK